MNIYDLFGPFIGKVTDNEDPDKLGRAKAVVEFMGDTIETDWIPVMTLYGTAECGAYFMPEVDDQVLVGFFGDTPDKGIILGSMWSDTQVPPETGENTASDLNQDGENNLRFIKSRSGHQIIFDDKDGEEKIQILAAEAKSRVEFLAKDKLLNFETDKDMAIKTKGKLGMEAEEGEFKFQKNLKIDADGVKIESSGQDIEIKASINLSVEGTTIKLN